MKNKKKIAVGVYGFLRHFEEARNKSKSFFDDSSVDVDLFFFCPKFRNDPQAVAANREDIISNEMITKIYGKNVKQAILWDYDFSIFENRATEEDLPLFNKRLIPCSRYYSLFYHMQNVANLINKECKNGTTYDRIFITRGDLSLQKFFGFQNQKLAGSNSVITLPKRPVVYHNVRFDDRFFSIKMEHLEALSEIYDSLDSYIKEEKLLFIPEDLTCHHFCKNGFKVENHMMVDLTKLLFHAYRKNHRYEHLTGRKLSTLAQTLSQQEKLIINSFKDYDDKEMSKSEQELVMKRLLAELHRGTNFKK
jgi:hypothetical protein